MMQRKGKASGLLLLTLGFAGCAQTDYKVSQSSKTRWRPVDNQAIAQARVAPAPKILPETHFAAGVLLEQQGAPGQAVEQYRRAILLNHDYAEAYHRLGVLMGVAGQHVEAEQNLRKAVALKPQQAFFRNDLGFVMMQRKAWVPAEQEFRATLDLYPRMPRGHVNLGLALAGQGRFDEALSSFRTVLPEADAQFNFGLVLRGQQRYADAARAFRRALEVKPLFIAAATQLAQVSRLLNGSMPDEPYSPTTTPNEPVQYAMAPTQVPSDQEAMLASAATQSESNPLARNRDQASRSEPQWIEVHPDDSTSVTHAATASSESANSYHRAWNASTANPSSTQSPCEDEPILAHDLIPGEPAAWATSVSAESTSGDVQFVPLTNVSTANTANHDQRWLQGGSMTPREFQNLIQERRARAGSPVHAADATSTAPRSAGENSVSQFHPVTPETQRTPASPVRPESRMAARGQGPLPAEHPLDWLDSLSRNSSELEISLNNLRCEMAQADMEPLPYLGFSQGYTQPPTMGMSIAPEESVSLNESLERVIESEPTTVQPTTESAVQVVPMTDPADQPLRTQSVPVRERESRPNRRTR